MTFMITLSSVLLIILIILARAYHFWSKQAVKYYNETKELENIIEIQKRSLDSLNKNANSVDEYVDELEDTIEHSGGTQV